MPAHIRELFRKVAETHGIEGVDFSEPTGDFYTANGLRFHYLDWGGNGYPVVFLHGNLQSANTWDLIAVQMRDQYHCYGLDQRNHGETDRVRESAPNPFGNNRAAMIEDVKAFVDHLGLKEYFLVGMSMGGSNSMGFIHKYPQGIKALALVDATPGFLTPVAGQPPPPGARLDPDRPNFRFLNEFESLEQAVDLAMKANPGRPRVHLEYTLTNSLTQREDGKWVWKRPRLEPMQPPRREPPSLEQVAEQRKQTEQQWEDLKQIAIPTLLVLGGDSDRTSPEHGIRFAAAVKGSKVVTLPGAAHNVQGDQPKALGTELLKFWEGVRRD